MLLGKVKSFHYLKLFDFYLRADAQRVAEEKKRKDKEIEMLVMAGDKNELEGADDLKVDYLFLRVAVFQFFMI